MTRFSAFDSIAPLGAAFGRQDPFAVSPRKRRSQSRGPQFIEGGALDPEEERTLLSKVMGGVQYIGETLDKPGSAVRGLLAGRPEQLLNLVPFSDTWGLTNAADRTSGRDLLEQVGIASPNQPGLFNNLGDFSGDVGGFLLEIITDPLTWIAGPLGATSKAAKEAARATRFAASGMGAKVAGEAFSVLADAGKTAGRAVTPSTFAEQVTRGERGFFSIQAPGPLAKLIPGQKLIGTGKRAGKVAEKISSVLFRNPASRAARSLLGPHLNRATNAAAQVIRDQSHAESRFLLNAHTDTLGEFRTAEKEISEQISKLAKHHEGAGDFDSVSVFNQVGKDWGERHGRNSIDDMIETISRHANMSEDTIRAAGIDLPLLSKRYDDLLHALANTEAPRYASWLSLGGRGSMLKDAMIDKHMPRRLVEPARGAVTAASKDKDKIKSGLELFEHSLRRGDTWRNIPGGTASNTRFSMNPLLTGTEKVGVPTVKAGAAQGVSQGVIVQSTKDRNIFYKVMGISEDGKKANLFYRDPDTALTKYKTLPVKELTPQYYGAPDHLDNVHYVRASKEVQMAEMQAEFLRRGIPVAKDATLNDLKLDLLTREFAEETTRTGWQTMDEMKAMLGRDVLTKKEFASLSREVGVNPNTGEAIVQTKEEFLATFVREPTAVATKATGVMKLTVGKSQAQEMLKFFNDFGPEIAHRGMFGRGIVADHTSYMTSILEQESTLRSVHKYLDDAMAPASSRTGVRKFISDTLAPSGRGQGIRRQTNEAADQGMLSLGEVWKDAGFGKAGLRTFADRHFADEIGDAIAAAGKDADIDAIKDKVVDSLLISPRGAAPLKAFNEVMQPKVQGAILEMFDRVTALYKGMLTVSGGPVWGLAFHTRNRGSGFWQAWSDGKVSAMELLAGSNAADRHVRGKTAEFAEEFLSNGGIDLGQVHDLLSKEAATQAARTTPRGFLGGAFEPFSPKRIAKAKRERGFQAFNPAHTRGVVDSPKSILGESGENLYKYVEWQNRYGYYHALRKKGHGIAESMEAVTRSQFDYSALSDFEKTVARRAVPFYCVPVDCEILTRGGWKTYDEVRIGEEVLGYDVETQTQQWTEVEGVSVFDYDGELMTLETPRSGANWAFTPSHRWPVRRTVSSGKHKHDIVKGYELRSNHAIPCAAPFNSWGKSAFTPRESAIIGWLVTDGHMRKKDWAIYQSPKKFADEIRTLLGEDGLKEYVHPDTGVIRFTIRAALVRHIKAKGFRGREDLSWVVGQLDLESAEIMWDAMYKADGVTAPCRKDSGDFFAAQDPLVFDAAQMLVQLLGMHMHRTTKGGYVSKSHHWCKTAGKLGVTWFKGQVWCPQTSIGTWVMRRDGRIIITGNSWSRKNIPYQFSKLLEAPGGRAAQTIRLFGQADDEQYTPSFLREGMALRAGGTERAATFLKQGGIPIEDLNKFVSSGGIPSSRTFEKLAAQLHPLISMPIEAFADKQFFTGRSLKNLRSTTGRLTEAITGTPRPNRLADSILHYSPLSRAAGELLGVIDDRKPIWQRAANALTGLKFSTYDAAQQRLIDLSRAMEEELRDSQFVREGRYYYVPEDQKAAAIEEQEKIRRIGGIRKEQQKLRESGVTPLK